MRCRTVALSLSVLSLAALSPGCGSGEKPVDEGPTVTLRVTEDFGRELLTAADDAPLPSPPTILELLSDHTDVHAVSNGQEIEAIDEVYDQRLPYPRVWAQNVNGIETDEYPVDYRLFDGDVVQVDLRYWHITLDVRATVGAFPETFTRGVFGRRFPTEVVCRPPRSAACTDVKQTMRDAGVDPTGGAPPGDPPRAGQPQRARILVGPWGRIGRAEWPRLIDRGPRYSGVFARFAGADRSRLELLDAEARTVVADAGRHAGLVAALRPTEEDLLWLVTGTTARGAQRAARALTAPTTRDAFSVAITAQGPISLPMRAETPLTGTPVERGG
ncbi:MAG: hypothetical protein GXY03_01015 [Solirubrobacterales bacterium]|nr:hypothetical protein [Solirubrobacterales bacterium]